MVDNIIELLKKTIFESCPREFRAALLTPSVCFYMFGNFSHFLGGHFRGALSVAKSDNKYGNKIKEITATLLKNLNS